MATNFKLNYMASITPIESVTLSDGSETTDSVNSNIDKIISSGISKTIGTAKTNIGYGIGVTTASGIDMTNWTLDNIPTTIKFLFIRIVSAASSGTPDAYISLDADVSYPIILTGVGDLTIIPMSVIPTDILRKSSSATTIANIEVIVGGA